jgi:hypothetical protein
VRYYVNRNAQANGDHEVHQQTCTQGPAVENRQFLGDFASCGPAVREAKRTYPTANGCFYCSTACHTS